MNEKISLNFFDLIECNLYSIEKIYKYFEHKELNLIKD